MHTCLTYMCIHTYGHAHTCMCTCACSCTCACVHTCACPRTPAHEHVCVLKRTPNHPASRMGSSAHTHAHELVSLHQGLAWASTLAFGCMYMLLHAHTRGSIIVLLVFLLRKTTIITHIDPHPGFHPSLSSTPHFYIIRGILLQASIMLF